jgi:hypothetical protein
MSAELNETKKKLTLATGLDEIKAKDAVIKKLNASLQLMYRDVEEKTKELEEARKAVAQASAHIKARPGSGPTSAPEGSASDAETIKQLRAELEKMKTQVTQRPRNMTIRPGLMMLPPALVPPPLSMATSLSAATGAGLANSATEDDMPPPPPEEEGVPYAMAKFWLPAESKRVALASLLTDPDMTFVDVLGRAIAGGNDADACASYLISLYSSQDTLMEVLEHLIRTEVNRCKSVNTLFRGEELSSRVLRSYVRMNGFEYIQKILGALVEEVASNVYFFEVDPNRANPTMDLKDNFVKLEQLTQRFLDTILDSYIWVPPEFLRLCKCIYTHSAVRFANEDFEQLVVAGFMFLRFICPAIAAPESFNLTPIESPEARRTLLLVGKILQNLANGVEFKEPYLQDMNNFLTKNAQKVANFFQKLRTYPVEIDGNAPYMVDISRSVYGRREKIKTTATAEGAADKRWECEIVTPLAARLRTLLTSVASAGPASQVGANPDLVRAFSNLFLDNGEMIPKLLTAVPHAGQSSYKTVAEPLATLSYHFNEIGFLARMCAQNESVPSAYEFLHSSLTKHVFGSFSMNFCGPWLNSIIGEVVSSIINQNTFLETDPSKITDPAIKGKYNRDEMLVSVKKISNSILQALIAGLPRSPRPLWLFCNSLALNTSQDIPQFLLLHFIVPALENPHLASLASERPSKKEAARSLQIIADVLRNYANASTVLIDQVPMSQAGWTDNFHDHIANWSRSLPGYLSDPVSNLTPDQLGSAVVGLAAWLQEHLSKFDQLLDGIMSTSRVVLGIHEFMDSLTPPPEKPVVQPAGSPAPGSRPGSGRVGSGQMDPKDLKKKLKEEEEKRKKEEKKKKEEDEKRKKEEEKKKKEEDKKKSH